MSLDRCPSPYIMGVEEFKDGRHINSLNDESGQMTDVCMGCGVRLDRALTNRMKSDRWLAAEYLIEEVPW